MTSQQVGFLQHLHAFTDLKNKHGGGCWMFSLPHFHFRFKSVNISTILTSKLKMSLYVWRLVSWLSLGIYIS